LTYKEKVTCKTSTEKLDTKKRVVCDINICQAKAVIFWRYYAKWKFQAFKNAMYTSLALHAAPLSSCKEMKKQNLCI